MSEIEIVSGPINLKDITKEQAEQFAEQMDEDFGRFLRGGAIPVENFANALIQAGIVSPPAWIVERNCDNVVNNGPFMTRSEAEQYLRGLKPGYYTVKIWQGQKKRGHE